MCVCISGATIPLEEFEKERAARRADASPNLEEPLDLTDVLLRQNFDNPSEDPEVIAKAQELVFEPVEKPTAGKHLFNAVCASVTKM